MMGTRREKRIKIRILKLLDSIGNLSEDDIHFFYSDVLETHPTIWGIVLHMTPHVSDEHLRDCNIPFILRILDEMKDEFHGYDAYINRLEQGKIELSIYTKINPRYVGWDNERYRKVKQ